MKRRRASLVNRENKERQEYLHNTQGVPHCVLFNGTELKRVFNNDRILGHSDTKTYSPLDLDIPNNEGSILFNDEHYSLFVFRYGIGIVVGIYDHAAHRMLKESSSLPDIAWYHDYNYYFIDDRNDALSKEGAFDIRKQHPSDLRGRGKRVLGQSIYTNVYNIVKKRGLNRFTIINRDAVHIVVPRTGVIDDKRLLEVMLPFRLAIYFDVKREDFIKYVNSSVQKLCYLRFLVEHEDVYFLICHDYRHLWRPEQKPLSFIDYIWNEEALNANFIYPRRSVD